MTVGTKMHQTLASLESALASFKTFTLDTDNQQAKQLYAQLANTMEQQVINPFRSRVNQMEQQEPQYNVRQQAMQQAAQATQAQSAQAVKAQQMTNKK